MDVTYAPGSLDPIINVDWINADLEPIPIGVHHGDITSSATDNRICHRIAVWLTETTGSGEESQIGRNDVLLKTIMCIAGIADFFRNTTTDTTTRSRPDFTALYEGVPVLIVEEKEGDAIRAAKNDIINKFVWIPNLHRLPFFIGIAFSFTHVGIVQLKRNEPAVTLFSRQLNSFKDRLAVLKPAINVARVLKHFIDSGLMEPAGLSMEKWHNRPCDKD